MTEEWKRCMNNGKVIGVIFIDFKKALENSKPSVYVAKLLILLKVTLKKGSNLL